MKNQRLGAAFFAALLVLLTACSGPGGHAGLTPGASAPSAARQNVKLKIKIPKRAKASKRHRGHYVSAATTQMMINVSDQLLNPIAGYPITVALTPTSAGCTSTLANTFCQLNLTLAVGQYVVWLTAEDANGSTISEASQVPLTVVAGQANIVTVSLDGVPHALTALQLGAGSQSFVLNALDTDGNEIVGPGAPVYAVARTSGIAVAISQPASTTPNTFSVGTTGAGTASLAVTASFPDTSFSPCNDVGAVCSAQFTLTSGATQQSLFVANTFAGIVQFAPPYGGTPVGMNNNGTNAPIQIAFAPNGNLFVANSDNGHGLGNVTEYAPGYTGAPIATIKAKGGLLGPTGVAFDPSGNLFVADYWNAQIVEYAPPYTGSPVTTISGLGAIYSIAFDTSGNLFAVDDPDSQVYELALPYTGVPTATITDSLHFPQSAVVDSSGNLFVVNDDSTILEYAPPYTGSPTQTITNGLSQPANVALDASSNLYVSNVNFNNPFILVYAPPYSGTPQSLTSSALASPAGLAFQTVYTVTLTPSP